MCFWKQVGLFVFPLVAFGMFLSSPSASAAPCDDIANEPQCLAHPQPCESGDTICTSCTVRLTACLAREEFYCKDNLYSRKCIFGSTNCPSDFPDKIGNCGFDNSACCSYTPATLSVSTLGSGKVTSTDSICNIQFFSSNKIDCGSTCQCEVKQGTSIVLSAKPDAGNTFDGWGGACGSAGKTTTCSLTAGTEALNVTAKFVSSANTLTINKPGKGAGTVTSAPAGISCGTDCTENFATGTSVTLTATADSGSTFAGWASGGCSGTGTCVVSMTEAKTVQAVFNSSGSGSTCTSQNGGNAQCKLMTACSSTANIIPPPSGGFSDCTDPIYACCSTTTLPCVSSLRPGYSCNTSSDCQSGTTLGKVDCTGDAVCCKKTSSSGKCTDDTNQACDTNCDDANKYSGAGTGTCDPNTLKCCKKKAATTGKCTDDPNQKCAADCAKETGYEDGGTGTCDLPDPNKPLECCKKKSTSTKCLDTSGQICAEACTGAYESGSGNCDTSGQVCCKPKAGSDQPTSPQCGPSEKSSLVPCGRSCDNPDTYENEAAVCTLCHLLLLIRNITDWIFMVMTYIAFAVLVAMGILYIVSTGKPQLIGVAKSGIWAALVGFAIVLLGWVAINVILMVLADGVLGTDTASFSIKDSKTGKWFEYNCDAQTRYGGAGGAGGGGGGVPPGTGPTGPASGNCSVASLKTNGADCFGSDQLSVASCVCQGESLGNPLIGSFVDKCKVNNCTGSNSELCSGGPDCDGIKDVRDSFSVGLFQMNISVHPIAGLNCPSAFQGKNSDCVVKDCSLYRQCYRAAQNASTNIREACKLYHSAKNHWGQWGAYKDRNCAGK